jgi:hypothetical protein
MFNQLMSNYNYNNTLSMQTYDYEDVMECTQQSLGLMRAITQNQIKMTPDQIIKMFDHIKALEEMVENI